ncbi:EAL domain-containing protein [Kluyvera cryocrescens]|uniref:EAL domain-containing protein n=1 Tax=Kluyvera cryocrescens TaxID=580 RepID=UPI003D7F4BEC
MPTQRPVRHITSVLIVSIFLPIAMSLWLAHRQAHELFKQEMDSYTESVLERTRLVKQQARTALAEANGFHGVPCSPEHLQQIQKVSYIHQYIQSIFYLENTDRDCTMLRNSLSEKVPGSEYVTPAGYHVWLTSRHDLNTDDNMVAISRGKYMAMIDPDSLIDVLPHPRYPIYAAIISTRGQRVIASNHPLDPHIWQNTLHTFQPTLEVNGMVYRQQVLPPVGAILLTWAPTAPIDANLIHQLLFWLPVGLVLSGLATFIVLRIVRRLQSSHYRILDAIKEGEFTVHYQPIVELKSGRVIGAEALARWQQPEGRWLPPDIFIDLAEQAGVIRPLTEYIVRSVFNDMGRWLAQHPDLYISINIAAADLHSPTLPVLINQQVKQWQVSTKQIAIELTERNLADPETAIPVLQAYRELGHTVYIDDFGVGYSSLSYLQDLEVDTLKIDKSFIDTLESNQVIGHIIEMAKSLNLSMVAEGIECAHQRDWLVAHGVRSGQGWLFSKPLPKDAFIDWVNDNLNRPMA